jgi:hypothetical protein
MPRLKQTKPLYHVSASVNRSSIERHGLDWTRMEAAFGIAGSHEPEADGIFLARGLWEAYWFAGFGAVSPVDVWKVEPAGLRVERAPEGFLLCRSVIGPDRLELLESHESTAFGKTPRRRA